ncbi:MAG: hypothetical protein J0H81_00655 [Sphingopyxis terrae]|mgnify:CR=1 FL=1|nr:hypothetical protein [Sphingopyxis terrae]
MSAQSIYDTAPLCSLIRFTNGEPCPPQRFNRKLRAWNNDNGMGRLIGRWPSKQFGSGHETPATFALHIGNYGSQGIVTIVVTRHYSIDSQLRFEILERPRPGMVRIITSFDGLDELRFLASDMRSAEDWIARNRYSNMRTEIVGDPDPVALPSGIGRAA